MFSLLSIFGGVKQVSLADMTKRVRRRRDRIAAELAALSGVKEPERPPTRNEIFMRFDPDLANAHKELVNAKSDYKKLRRLYGSDEEPMVEIAFYAFESARCRFETRLLELMGDCDFMRAVTNANSRIGAQYARGRDAFASVQRRRADLLRVEGVLQMLLGTLRQLEKQNVKKLGMRPDEDIADAVNRAAAQYGLVSPVYTPDSPAAAHGFALAVQG